MNILLKLSISFKIVNLILTEFFSVEFIVFFIAHILKFEFWRFNG